MPRTSTRRAFLRRLGLSAASLPFVWNLPSLGWASNQSRKKRLVVVFSPNGIVPSAFWPEREGGDFELKEILKPLAPFKQRTLVLHGVCDKVRGDGDNHMRGMGCLLTGAELFPGNIQGGSHTPAGWSSGISVDQEIKNHLQKNPTTATRFGSLEFGVFVPERADTWTRMVYAGPNRPIAPISDPYQMFRRLYGQAKDQENVRSVLDDLQEDLRTVSRRVSADDRRLLEEHAGFVRAMEKEFTASAKRPATQAPPDLPTGVKDENDNMPQLSRMHIDLMVNSFQADFARVATLQYTHSVGQARMRWLDVKETHHELSHNPDTDLSSQDKLIRINRWYAEQLAYLAKRLADTPEPGGPGSLLDNTLVVWTNELGKGNSHTLDNIPFVLVGGGLDFRMGRFVKYRPTAHNRLLLALAQGMDVPLARIGNPDFCGAGPLADLS